MGLEINKGMGTGKEEEKKTEKNEETTGKKQETKSGIGSKNKLELEAIASQKSVEKCGKKFFDNREAHQIAVSSEHVRWLTSIEAAQYLRVSLSGLKTMIYRGQVRAHKLGRRNRFLREELERLITLPNLTR